MIKYLGKITALSIAAAVLLIITPVMVQAQSDVGKAKVRIHAKNKPLVSLQAAAERSMGSTPKPASPREIPNRSTDAPGIPSNGNDESGTSSAPDPILQSAAGQQPTSIGSGFFGASNDDNATVNGYRVAPPDTDGEVGRSYFVQMINSLTTVFDKNGVIVTGPAASNIYWAGIGGNCEPYNQGDPIVLFDENADRWLVSQFAFPSDTSTYSQCVAVSQTSDPTGGWNRYEYSFVGIGFNDYPKFGIVSDSITMMANLFDPGFTGTFLGVMDKTAMYNGDPATLLGTNIGGTEFGFVAGDLDGPGSVPALFATAMSASNSFDIWKIDVDWSTEVFSTSRISRVPVSPFSSSLCGAFRGACVPQPDGGPALESLSGRLMHKLQIRDFGAYRTMVAAHTVNAGSGRAGIRWYELRETGGTWSLYQEGTFAPDDGQYRWMPSAAMNSLGDIGIGYLLGGPSTYVSTAVAGQSVSASGSGLLNSDELICAVGTGVQTGTGRSGDYSGTSVDPDFDTFWHTNEVFTTTGSFNWNTYVCEFSVGDGGSGNSPPTAQFNWVATDTTVIFTDESIDTDGTIASWDWDFGDTAKSVLQNPSHNYSATGDYLVTLTVTDDLGDTDSTSKTVSVQEPASSVHVASINASTLSADKGRKYGTATVTVVDDFGSPVAGYTITGDFGGDFSETLTSGLTDNNGQVTLQTSSAKKRVRVVTFCVSAEATGINGELPYNKADNTAGTTCAEPPPAAASVHVESVTTGTENIGGGNKAGAATILVVDDNGFPAEGYTVSGEFSGDFTESGSGVTSSDGTTTIQTSGTGKGKVDVSFCVSGVSKSGGLPYVDADNSPGVTTCP